MIESPITKPLFFIFCLPFISSLDSLISLSLVLVDFLFSCQTPFPSSCFPLFFSIGPLLFSFSLGRDSVVSPEGFPIVVVEFVVEHVNHAGGRGQRFRLITWCFTFTYEQQRFHHAYKCSFLGHLLSYMIFFL